MQRKHANFRTEPGHAAGGQRLGNAEPTGWNAASANFPRWPTSFAPFPRISAHQIGAIGKETLMRTDCRRRCCWLVACGDAPAARNRAYPHRKGVLRSRRRLRIGVADGNARPAWLNRLLRRNGRHTPCAVLRHGPGKCASYIALRYNKQAPRGATIS